jgi:hypothetical protein
LLEYIPANPVFGRTDLALVDWTWGRTHSSKSIL